MHWLQEQTGDEMGEERYYPFYFRGNLVKINNVRDNTRNLFAPISWFGDYGKIIKFSKM
jgi:hypothetical protein